MGVIMGIRSIFNIVLKAINNKDAAEPFLSPIGLLSANLITNENINVENTYNKGMISNILQGARVKASHPHLTMSNPTPI